MDKKHILKTVLKLGGSLCVGTTLDILIKQNVELEKPFEKVAVFIGSSVIGMMATEVTEHYISTTFDEISNEIRKIRNPQNNIKPKED